MSDSEAFKRLHHNIENRRFLVDSYMPLPNEEDVCAPAKWYLRFDDVCSMKLAQNRDIAERKKAPEAEKKRPAADRDGAPAAAKSGRKPKKPREAK